MRAVFCALCAVGALALFAAAAAQPAQAQAPAQSRLVGIDVGASLNVTAPSTASSLNDVFTNSPTSLAQALLCPVGQAIGGATSQIPGVGQLTDQLKGVLCALGIVGYAYRTTYIPANGQPIVRHFRALAVVPTLLDVNGDAVPDFTGTLLPNPTLNGVNLSISRSIAFSANAKVKIEAVLLNPTSPQSYLGIGEDGTAAGTASQWNTTVSLLGLSSSSVDLAMALSTSGAPSTLAAIGEFFSGSNPDAPQNVTGGRVAFTPVPSDFTTEIRASQGREEVIVTSPIPTKITGDLDVIRPGNQKNVHVVVDKLPAAVDVVHTTADGHENTTYTASAPVGVLSGSYHERAGQQILTAAQLDATAVPAKVTVDQADGKTVVDAPGASVGSVEARFAKGDEVPAPGAGDGAYAAFHRFSSSKLTAGLRLKNLKSVAIDQTGPYAGRLIFSAPLGPLPLSAQDDVSKVSLTGKLSNLPLDTAIVADLDNGVVSFDGHGTGIEQIVLHATKTGATFFSKVKRIDATIDGIPPLEVINFKQEDGAIELAASAPPTTMTLLASDGADAPAVDGSYAWFEDTATVYRAFARINGLQGIAFSSSPVEGSFDTAAPQVLGLHGEAGGVTADGKIDKLPSHVGFTVNGDRVHIDNNGTIDHINLQAKGLPASAKFRNAKVDIYGISPVLDVYLGINPADRSLARMTREQNCPQPEDCDPPEPPCDPRTEECEDPPCDPVSQDCPGEPEPPPPPPAELFGIDAHGHGIELITAHAWSDDADLALHPDLATNRSAARVNRIDDCPPEGCDLPPDCDPAEEDCDGDGGGGGGGCPCTPPPFPVPDTANAILYDGKTPGHEDLRARIVNLKHALYTKNALPTGPGGNFNGTDDIDVEFTQPGDLTLGIRKDDVHGTVKIPQVPDRTLPTKYGLQIGTRRVINAVFRPNAVIPQVDVSMAVGKDQADEREALISGTIANIPTEADVCIAKDGMPDCHSWMGLHAPGGASNRSISPEIDFNLTSNGPPVTDPYAMTVNARVCLGDIGSNAWVPAACDSDQTAKKYIDVENLRVSNFDVEYKGEGVAWKYQDNYPGDDSLAAYMNTDGVLVDSLKYVKDGGKGVEFVKTGQPLTAQDFFIAADYEVSARARVMATHGSLSCPPTTHLYLLERAADGSVSHWDPIYLPEDLWSLEEIVDIC